RQFETELIRRAMEDERFRRDLIENPSEAVERLQGNRMPGNVRIRVLEESDNTLCIVIPANPYEGVPEPELSALFDIGLPDIARWVCQDHASGGIDDRMTSLVVRAW